MKNILLYIFSSIIVLGIFAITCLLVWYPMPEANIQALNILLGALIGAFTTVISWYFGSSKSSSEKNETISNLAKQNTPT